MQITVAMPRVDALVDRVGREACRDEDHRRVRACPVDGVRDRVEDGNPLDVLAALAGRDAGNDLRPVRLVAGRMERALPARQSLDDEPGVAVDDDRH